MPLTSSADFYLSTLQEFIDHWTRVNADPMSNGRIVLRGGYTLNDLITDRTHLEQAIDAVAGGENARAEAAERRDARKTDGLNRLDQFRNMVRALLDGTPHAAALPNKPAFNTVESRFLRPLTATADLWGRINADTTVDGFTPPLLLAGGYTLAQYQTELAALRAAFAAHASTIGGAAAIRGRRDAPLGRLRERLNQYRAMVRATLPADHPLRLSLPALSAPRRPRKPETAPEKAAADV